MTTTSTTSTTSKSVSVAPRELFDLVVKCCRVCGLDPGTAHRVARNVVCSQATLGEGAAQLAAELARGMASFATSYFVWAPDMVAAVEVDARQRSETQGVVAFVQPVHASAYAATVAEAADRGVTIEVTHPSPSPDQPVDLPPDQQWDQTVDNSAPARGDELTATPLDGSAPVDLAHPAVDTSRLKIDRDTFDQLRDIAADFLVAEGEVDAVLGR